MESLEYYLEDARRAIGRWGCQAMLRDDDVVADVATKIMIADTKFDGRGSIRGFRMHYAQFAIKRAKTLYNKKRGLQIRSLDYDSVSENGSASNCHDYVQDDTQSPEDSLMCDDIRGVVEAADFLRDREKDAIIQYYFDNKTLREIAPTQGISYQAVCLNLKSGLTKLRSHLE
jgi:RNA polymerase sigma factor (sigma-70 family)